MAEKMYLTPYTYGPLPRPEFSRDGLQMNCDESALFLGNKMLPKDTVTLIELTVNSYTPLPNIRHLPIYVGFHEEPSLGILNASCCFGSLYYKEGADYDCFEHVAGGTTHTRFVPSKVYTRIPAATEVIGVKYNPINNEVSIYRDGNLFYKFSPQHNNLSIGDFYPSVFVMNNCNLNARINFGKKGLQFPQSDAMSLFGYYYKKKPLTPEIVFDFIAEPKPNRFMVDDEVLIDVKVDSDILPGAMVPLYMESPQAIFTDSTHLKFDINKPSTTNYDYFGATLTSNRGLPYDEKVYVEFQVKNGVLLNGTVGIPISVGISNTKGYIMNNSLRLNMFHLQQQTYQYKEVKRSVTTLLYTTSGIMTTVSPNQAMWVGVAFDLKNKEYTVYINSIPFYTVKVPSLKFTPGSGEIYYFMLHQEGIEKNDDPMDGNGGLPLKGEVNFGQTPFHTVLPSGYMTLWDYYNNYYHIPILPYREICFDFMAYPYKMKLEAEILWHFRVIGQELFGQEASMNPGLNQFKGTMNRITDYEEHFIPDQGIQLLDLLMRFDNFNYTTEKLFEKEDFFRGQDIYIGNWENRVLRYIDFDLDCENIQSITLDIKFSLTNANDLTPIIIDFDANVLYKLGKEIEFEITPTELDFISFDIVNGSITSAGVATFTFMAYQFDIFQLRDGISNPNYGFNKNIIDIPLTYEAEDGTIVTKPESSVIKITDKPKYCVHNNNMEIRTWQEVINFTGIFSFSSLQDKIPKIGSFSPTKKSSVYQVNKRFDQSEVLDSIMDETTFDVNDYIFDGTTTISLNAGVKICDLDWEISGVIQFPIKYVNMSGVITIINENDSSVSIVGNKVKYVKSLSASDNVMDYIPVSGVFNYSNVTSNIIQTTNIIAYSGDMNLDFNAMDFGIEYTNTKNTVMIGSATEWFVENTIKVTDEKWEVIKHYISTGDLNKIRVKYYFMFMNDEIVIPASSIDVTQPYLIYTRPYADAKGPQTPTNMEGHINQLSYEYNICDKEFILE